MRYRVQAVRREQSRTVRKLCSDNGGASPDQRAHVAKVEVLVIRSGVWVHLQVRPYPLRSHRQTALFQPRHRLVVLRRRFLQAEFLGEEEEGLVFFAVKNTGNIKRAADRPTEILPPIEWSLVPNGRPRGRLPQDRRLRIDNIEEIARVKRFVAHKVVKVSVPL